MIPGGTENARLVVQFGIPSIRWRRLVTIVRTAVFAFALSFGASTLAAQFPAAVIPPDSLARLDSAARRDSIRLSGGELQDWRLADSLTAVATGEVVREDEDSVSFRNGSPAPYTGSGVPLFAIAGVGALLAGVALIRR